MPLTVFFMRGVSGSGKTTYIEREIKPRFDRTVVVSSDHYWTDRDGTYNFVKSKLYLAHLYCERKFRKMVRELKDCQDNVALVLDNTNIARSSMIPYATALKDLGYEFLPRVIELRVDPKKAFIRSTHGVDLETIQKWTETLEKNRDTLSPWDVTIVEVE